MLGQLAALPADLGKLQTMLGDNGYFSADNVTACAAAEIAPLLAPGRTPLLGRALCRGAASAREPDATRSHVALLGDA
jgi:hypothetical protein